MSKNLDKDLELLDEAMSRFVQSMSRPRAWEDMAARAGVSIDRAGAVMLQFMEDSETQGCHLSELAHKLGIEAPSVTRKVQQLERYGLLRRVPDPEDRRAYVLETTKSGRKILSQLHQAKHAMFAEVLAGWPAEDRHSFAKLFYRLAQDLTTVRQPKH